MLMEKVLLAGSTIKVFYTEWLGSDAFVGKKVSRKSSSLYMVLVWLCLGLPANITTETLSG